MGKRNKSENTEAAPMTQVETDNIEINSETKPILYVVVREGFRVSDREYLMPDDPEAIKERDYWRNIANKHSYKEKVDVVQYDSKRHRIW